MNTLMQKCMCKKNQRMTCYATDTLIDTNVQNDASIKFGSRCDHVVGLCYKGNDGSVLSEPYVSMTW